MKTVKLLFFGDLCCSTKTKLQIDQSLQEILVEHDLVSVNFEGPIEKCDHAPAKKVGPHLFQHYSVIQTLEKLLCKTVNLANNHIFDYGSEGLSNTQQLLKDYIQVGAGNSYSEAIKLKKIKLGNALIGLLSFGEAEFGVIDSSCKNSSGFAWIDDPFLPSYILEAKKIVDILIIQVHAGIENIFIPLPEWRSKYKSLASLGADVVIGHHPHVIQSYEKIGNSLIFYSLGNLYFDTQLENIETSVGYGLSLLINNKKISNFNLYPIRAQKNLLRLATKEESDSLISKTNILNEDCYENNINKIATELFSKYYEDYYWKALLDVHVKNKFFRPFVVIMKTLLGKKLINPLFFIHNIKIESHRWIVLRAMNQLLNQTSNK